MKRSMLYSVVFLLVVAAITARLSNLDLIEYKLDEKAWIGLAYNNIHAQPALTGLKSSAGMHNPPLFGYILCIPVYFSSDPVFVTSFIILLNILGLSLLYYYIRRYFSHGTALITILLFASSPWAILCSRKIWSHYLMFPFLVLFYGLLLSVAERYSRIKVLLLFFVFSIVTQMHMSTIFMLVPLSLFILFFKVRIRALDFLSGCVLFLVPYVPFIYYHIVNGFPKPSLVNRVDIYGNTGWSFIINGATNFEYYLGSGFDLFVVKYKLLVPQILSYFHLIVMGMALIYVIIVLAGKLKQHNLSAALEMRYKALSLFLMVYVFVQISFVVFKVGGYPHYNVILYPILAVFTGYFIDSLYQKYGVVIRALISCVVALIVISNLYFIMSFFGFIRHYPQWINGDYGIPYCLQGKVSENAVYPVVSVSYK